MSDAFVGLFLILFNFVVIALCLMLRVDALSVFLHGTPFNFPVFKIPIKCDISVVHLLSGHDLRVLYVCRCESWRPLICPSELLILYCLSCTVHSIMLQLTANCSGTHVRFSSYGPHKKQAEDDKQ
jgi:hypothetical protein